ASRRSPQDNRVHQIAFDRFAQRLARRKELVLSHQLSERAWPHPLGQWAGGPRASLGIFGKERVHKCSTTEGTERNGVSVLALCLADPVHESCAQTTSPEHAVAGALRRSAAPPRPRR